VARGRTPYADVSLNQPLPLIPHCDLEPECCGCLMAVMGEDGIHFRCNECGVVSTKEQVAPCILATESCEATWPHCGHANHINGFQRFPLSVPSCFRESHKKSSQVSASSVEMQF
jgi:hypothetical protein